MNVEHLREFIALAKTRNFTKTAHSLSVAQSTLSKHIASLEGELGFRLFDRTAGTVVLTDEGKALFEDASMSLEMLDKGIVRARLLNKARLDTVRIGGYLQIASITNWIYRVETVAHDVSPSLRVSLYAPHTIDYMPDSARDDALDLLEHGIIDVALIEGPRVFPELDRFAWRHVFDEPIVFFTNVASELAERSRVNISDLRGKRFIGSLNYPQFQDRVRELCVERGFMPEFGIKMVDTFNEFIRSDDPDEVFFLSASGAARVPDPPYSPLAKLPVGDPEAFSPVYAVWRKDADAAVRTFAESIDELELREDPATEQDGDGSDEC